jgi:hypothetical protein
MDGPGYSIGDMTALSDKELLIIERDPGQGDASDPRFNSPARFKKIFKVALDQVDANGNLIKEEVADLLNIYVPRDVAADGRTNTVFTFPFQTIEDLLVLDNNTLLVINDNNFPFSVGRAFGAADNNEFITIHTAPLLSKADDDCGRWRDGDDVAIETIFPYRMGLPSGTGPWKTVILGMAPRLGAGTYLLSMSTAVNAWCLHHHGNAGGTPFRTARLKKARPLMIL